MSTIEQFIARLKNGGGAVIRSATAADAGAIVDLWTRVVAEGAYTLAEPGERPMTEADERQAIDAHARGPGDLYLVAEIDGALAGWLTFERGQVRRLAHRGEFSLFVSEGLRGCGVGTALLGGLLAWAALEPGIEKVALAVFSTNPRAIGLYRKLGFVEEGRCPRDMKLSTGEYIDSVLMYRFVKESQRSG